MALACCHCGSSGNPVADLGGEAGGISQTGGIGGSIAATDPNTAALVVDSGPAGAQYTNGIFATVTLCVPGTSDCQTFDHLLVDTGSVGVRVLESELRLALPAVTNNNLPVAECTPFVDGTAWGPVRTADVRVGAEAAPGLSVQVIGEGTFAMPFSCTGTPITTLQELSANGILGIGTYLQDCGSSCALGAGSTLNPGLYYSCSSAAACTAAAMPVTAQVANPVAAFPVDNNGTIIRLANVPTRGAPSAPGVLIFGIGTQANNGLGDATVLGLDGRGFVDTTFPANGSTTYTAYLDSGSNALFFLDAKTTKIAQCAGSSSFYCPPSTVNLNARVSAANGASTTVAFSVANADKLDGSAFAFSNLAGPMPGFPTDTSVPGFDWGLPFYFGRSVYTALEKRETPNGPGPYFAF